MIKSIESITHQKDHFIVDAVIEDGVMISGATLYDPPEYADCICRASVSCLEEEITIDNLTEMCIEWVPIDDNDW
jgi:hypothetical protein